MQCHVDYFAVTVFGDESIELITRVVHDVFIDIIDVGHGGLGYRSSMVSASGCRIYYNPVVTVDNVQHCYLQLSAKGLNFLDFERMRHVLGFIPVFKVKRLDLAIDHYDYSPQWFFDKIDSDCYRCRSHKKTLTIIRSPYADKQDGTKQTSTVYFGSRKSERFIRVYDLHGFTRVELELKGDKADAVYHSYPVGDLDKQSQYIKTIINDFITIYDGVYIRNNKSTHKIDSLWMTSEKSTVKYSKDIEEVTLTKAKQWIQGQASNWLAVLSEVEPEFIQSCIDNAKLQTKHKNIIVNHLVDSID